ncbi:hypothetical protein ACER0C_006281 [Sarotherodon galilaeus]
MLHLFLNQKLQCGIRGSAPGLNHPYRGGGGFIQNSPQTPLITNKVVGSSSIQFSLVFANVGGVTGVWPWIKE